MIQNQSANCGKLLTVVVAKLAEVKVKRRQLAYDELLHARVLVDRLLVQCRSAAPTRNPYQHPLPPTPSTNPFGRGLNTRRLSVSLDDNNVPRLVCLPRQKHAEQTDHGVVDPKNDGHSLQPSGPEEVHD